MATSYKIRLRRFNGLDYDILNLSSDNIIMNDNNTLEAEVSNIKQNIENKAPTDHASPDTTYGVGNYSNYGHVKLSDTPDANQQAGDGYAATPASVANAPFVSYAAAMSLTDAQQTQARDNIGANWDLLWENASMTSQFAAQTITVDFSTYERIMVFYNITNDNYRQLLTGIDVVTTGGVLQRTTVGSNVGIVDTRSFNLSGGNQIAWADCYHTRLQAGSTPVVFSIDNTSCIPYAIYGVKK